MKIFKREKKLNISMFAVMIPSIIVAVMLVTFYFYQTKKAFEIIGADEVVEFNSHYAFISADMNDDFFESVYDATKEAGIENKDYVEYFGKDLATEYSKEQLIEIAIASDVDGIFLEADESNEIVELIDKAVSAGIPVVTMGSDCTASKRQSFVGVNNFSLGQEYGRQIIKMADKEPKNVMVLMNPNSADTSQNIVYAAIREQLEINGRDDIVLQTFAIDNDSTFSVEESIRDIIIKPRTMPDIMVCLSESNTGSAYQATVDYNRVGSIEILGYHKNSSILDGIAQKNIYATFVVDTNQMGKYLIDAMDEYREYGYVNEYMTVDVNIINEDNVEGYADELE